MSSIRGFVSGLIVGSLLVSGVGYAASQMNIEVATPLLRYIIDGKEVIPGDKEGQYYNGKYDVPSGFIYKGTTYVPLRMIGEELDKQVTWDGKTYTITIADSHLELQDIKDISKAPAKVREWIDRSKGIELAQRWNQGDRTYLLVTRGQKNTGGFSVSISDVQETTEEIVVTVNYTDPKGSVTQAITHPYVLASIDKTEKPIRFIGKGDQFIPQLYGIDSIQPIIAETTNINLFEPKKSQSELVIHGVARVFEAVVQYEMLDNAGTSKAQGFTQAAVAGGDWGYFTVKIPLSELKNKQIQKIQLYTSSPKDGSKQDIVPLDIRNYVK